MRVVLAGASSVGKTTLANDFCHKHKHYKFMPEVARDVMPKHGIMRNEIEASLKTENKEVFIKLEHLIMEEQNRREKAIPNDQPVIIDRGPDALVFLYQCVSLKAAYDLAVTPAGAACLERYRTSLVVVVCPLMQPSDDGFRVVPTREEQEEYTRMLCELLCKYRIPYIYLNVMDRELRVTVLEEAVNGVFPLKLESQKYPLNIPFTIKRGSQTSTDSLLCAIDFAPDKVTCSFQPPNAEVLDHMIEQYGTDNFIVAKFDDKISPTIVKEVLQDGLLVNGEQYQFLGCSSSGLRNRTYYMYRGTVRDVKTVLSDCGLFSEI